MENTMSTIEAGRVEGEKFLTFRLGGEEYGLEIMKVREIIGLIDITEVPGTPPFIRGVVNLRGKVIPVMDLRVRFGITQAGYTEETCIIVVEIGGMLMGTIIDTVLEVIEIQERDIEPFPSIGIDHGADFILGMGKVGKKVKILLDIDRVISGEGSINVSDFLAGRQGI